MSLGNIGISGLILIVIVLVLVFGPSKLPELGKAFGKSLREFREATRGLSEDIAGGRDEARRTTVVDAETTPVRPATTVEPIELREPKDS